MMKFLNCGCAEKWGNFAPFLLRVAVGAIFFAHGWQKLGGVSQFGGFLEKLDIPLPIFFAWIIVLLEIIGGASLILGFLTHWFAKLLAVEMIIAILLVHLKNGFFASEFALIVFAASVSLMTINAGKWSLDHLLFKKQQE